MGSYSTYFANKVLEYLLSLTEAVAVSTANPLVSGAGIAEPVGNGYARVAISESDWNTPSNGAVSNALALSFPTATGPWGTISYFMLMDALTAGNMLAYGQTLDPSGNVTTKVIANGDILSIGAGSLVITQL